MIKSPSASQLHIRLGECHIHNIDNATYMSRRICNLAQARWKVAAVSRIWLGFKRHFAASPYCGIVWVGAQEKQFYSPMEPSDISACRSESSLGNNRYQKNGATGVRKCLHATRSIAS